MHYVAKSYKYIVEEVFLMNNQELLQKIKEDMEMSINVENCDEKWKEFP